MEWTPNAANTNGMETNRIHQMRKGGDLIQRDRHGADMEPIGTQRSELDWNGFDLDEPNGKR